MIQEMLSYKFRTCDLTIALSKPYRHPTLFCPEPSQQSYLMCYYSEKIRYLLIIDQNWF